MIVFKADNHRKAMLWYWKCIIYYELLPNNHSRRYNEIFSLGMSQDDNDLVVISNNPWLIKNYVHLLNTYNLETNTNF